MKLNRFDKHATGYWSYHNGKVAKGSTLVWEILINNVVCFEIKNEPSMKSIKNLALKKLFHCIFSYHEPSKCFVFSIWLAKSQDFASKYVGDLVIQGDNNKLSYEGIKVSSVGNVPSIDKLVEDIGNISLCLPTNLARSISVKKQEGDEHLSVKFSFRKI